MAILLNLIAGFLLGISIALHTIAIACPFWIKDGTYKFGLWKICFSGLCSTLDPGKWLISVQVFCSIGLLALVTAYLTSFMRLFVENGTKLLIITIVSNVTAVLALFIGTVVFGAMAPSDKFHFAFFVESLSLVVSSLSFAINVLDLIKSRNGAKRKEINEEINSSSQYGSESKIGFGKEINLKDEEKDVQMSMELEAVPVL